MGCASAFLLLLLATQEPLHERVDRLIAEGAGGRTAAARSDDAEFHRRAHLDFAGRIPTAAETRAFLSDESPDKRTRLIDRLLAAPEYADHAADRFDVMLMERRGEDKEWRTWLVESFRANKPWDRMAREILDPDFRDEKKRGAGFFITKRMEKYGQNPTDYPGLTRDVGRLFMGIDLRCAQCHKHLTVKEYKQVDFQGLFATYRNLKLQQKNQTVKVSWVSEGLMKEELEFSSVFKDGKKTTPPRVPFGEPIAIPDLEKGKEWVEPPDKKKKTLGRPAFSPLSEVARRLVSLDNPYFATNIANRAWFLLMGRGLVEPLDLFHDENLPSHPALFDLLGTELVAHDYDLKWLFRELALTEVYQRSSLLPEGVTSLPADRFLVAIEKPIAAEAFRRSVLVATGEFERKGKDAELRKAFHAALANAPREPEVTVNPTLKGALFMRNSDRFLGLIERRDGNLVDRMSKMKDTSAVAEELYLSVFSRLPDGDERKSVKGWLDRKGGMSPLVWALLSSAEFFVNH